MLHSLLSFLKLAWEELIALYFSSLYAGGQGFLFRAGFLCSILPYPPSTTSSRGGRAAFDNVNLATFNVKRELVVVRCGQQVVI